MTSLIRSRWAAVGAAVAVALGAGGLLTANAASDPSVFVAIDPTRVLDSRIGAGFAGALVNGTARKLDVTGTVPIVLPGDLPSTGSPVPAGATAIVANVTGITPSTNGYLAIRPGTATGIPSTSSINFTIAGVIVPNSVTVKLPTTGAAAGTIDLYFRGTASADRSVSADCRVRPVCRSWNRSNRAWKTSPRNSRTSRTTNRWITRTRSR